MKISGKTSGIINDISDSSGKFLKNNYEVSILIEISFFSDKSDLFRKLIFISKYVTGLKKVLTSPNISGQDYLDRTYADFNSNLQTAFDILRLILQNADKGDIAFFEKKYFTMSQESIVNMLDLSEDLTLCKEYENRYKGVFGE